MSEETLTPLQSLGQTPPSIDRNAWIERFLNNNRRTKWLFDLLEPEAYYERPIALRQPIVFYQGHLAGFPVNVLLKGALGRPGIDERLERVFARGIDPHSVDEVTASETWPSRDEVHHYVKAATEVLLDALRCEDFGAVPDPSNPLQLAAWTVVEHDPMHHETLLYMWHQLGFEFKRSPTADRLPDVLGQPVKNRRVVVPEGYATLGAERDSVAFGWDNEFPAHRVAVASFHIDACNVTNGEFMEFLESGGYREKSLWTEPDWAWLQSSGKAHPTFWVQRDGGWTWRGMFEEIALPRTWPVWVSQAEAAAYAKWQGRRLPTEAEFHRAAFGTPEGHENLFPWGNGRPEHRHGNFDLQRLDPAPVGSFPDGASAWGIHDLIGNGWEWTSTIFAPFKGFKPMVSYPEYSADFFDDKHFVLKGASPATSEVHIRRSFRNWFRPNYPYVYAAFRTVGL